MRLIILLFIVISASIAWYVRRVLARKRLRKIDEGQQCIACGASDVMVQGDEVRCQRCGVTASLSALSRTDVTEEELRNLTSLD